MKKFLLLNIFFLNSIFISAQDVDQVNSDSSGYVLLSTYEMAYGGKFKDLEKSLIEETKAGVKDGSSLSLMTLPRSWEVTILWLIWWYLALTGK